MFCNGLHGVYLLGRQRIVCSCPDCAAKPEAKREHSCTQFEMHCGAGAAKKWKASLRVEPGGVPEVPAGAALTPPYLPQLSGLSVGCRLDQKSLQVLPCPLHDCRNLSGLLIRCRLDQKDSPVLCAHSHVRRVACQQCPRSLWS